MEGVHIKLKVSQLRAFHSLVNEPDKYGEITTVVYEHRKRTQEMLFADKWAQLIQRINILCSSVRA